MWQEIFDSNRWSEGAFTAQFEELWGKWNEAPSLAFSSWGGAALAALEYVDVRGQVVLCPSNTFMATPFAAMKAGARVEFVDCRRDDLCMSFDDFVTKAELHKPKAAWLVHIGGHIAFDVEKIADYCRNNGITLLEDCAHAHGASWNGKKPGTWGIAGVYSFYATKTVSTGEGGMLVSSDADLIEFGKNYRNYGKFEYEVEGLNYRMSEFTAALGVAQAERLQEIVDWKNEYARNVLDPVHPGRLQLPDGMVSGFYKYVVFDPIEKSTGKVYDEACHRILKRDGDFPNTDWVAENHWCVPIYYHGGNEE
jgi:dTDP-4-amino-4,6-dideoxygalactose transaminase